MKKINKLTTFIFIFVALSTFSNLAKAQCPLNNEVLNSPYGPLSWILCESEGIFDLTSYTYPPYNNGIFTIDNPTFATAMVSDTEIDLSQIVSEPLGVTLTYVVDINGTTCTYTGINVATVSETPQLDNGSIADVDGTAYCSNDNSILLSPVSNLGTAITSINGGDAVTTQVYQPGFNGNLVDTITVIYGENCFKVDTFFVNVTPTPILENPDTLYTDQTAYTLAVNPTGGDFLLNGSLLTDTTIDVSTLTEGTSITIDYELNDCFSESQTIAIAAPIVVEEIDSTLNTPQAIDVFIANIFTPNQDTHNDIIYVRADDMETMNFQIFNRYGEKVFESIEQDFGWEGIDENGKELLSGVYFYQLLYTTSTSGVEIIKKGEITLVR